MSAEGLQASVEKMQREGVPDAAIATFRHYYEQLEAGESGMVPEDAIEPVRELPDAEALPEGDAPLDQAVVIKLNGGLGHVDGHVAGEVAARGQGRAGVPRRDRAPGARAARGERRAVPLVLMNSFYTRDDSLALLERYEELAADVPFDFVQHKEPKLLVDGLTPAEWPPDPSLEWCPPGHGDIYPALLTSGMLAALLERGYRYAFISNSDNLGRRSTRASSPGSPARGSRTRREVTDRTPADKKGGHIATLKETGGLILRETAQTPDGGHGRVHRRRPPPVLPRQQPVGRPAGARRAAARARRRARPADDRQREDRRPVGLLLARRRPAGDGDGRGDRRVRGGAGDPRAALALRAGQEDERPARAALGRLRARRRRADRAGGRARTAAPLVELDDEHFKLLARLRRPLPGRRAVAGARPTGWRSRAT